MQSLMSSPIVTGTGVCVFPVRDVPRNADVIPGINA